MDPSKFWLTMAWVDIWKSLGWWSTIYLAAITGISQELYEAAIVDGAGRFRRIWNITLPCIKPTIAIITIMNISAMLTGGIMGSNFNQSLLFGNALNRSTSEVLDAYTLRMGLGLGRFSFAAASGLLQSAVALCLFWTANFLSGKLADSKLI
jgi:putative aldouronate transport system permease protein